MKKVIIVVMNRKTGKKCRYVFQSTSTKVAFRAALNMLIKNFDELKK